MQYSMSFGKLTSKPKVREGVGETFGLAVLGDFSGRANRGELQTGEALAARKPRRVDIDNLDDVLHSMQLKLQLPIGDDGGSVEISISSMDDFHPDELYEKVEVFAELNLLRRKLQKSSSFSAAAEEVRSWATTQTPSAPRLRAKPRGEDIPNAKLSDFARLMGTTTVVQTQTPADELIKQIVRPFIEPDTQAEQETLLQAVDNSLTSLMRKLLHHPDFQTLESLWRSVDLLVRELETDATLQIILYDISAEEIAADLCSSENLEETGLYKLLVEQPALDLRTTPPSVIVGNYRFEQSPPHADLLGRLAKIAAAAQAPFIASISNEVFEKKKPEDVHPLVVESWDALRSLPHAAYLGLAVPRFMLRWPYGAKTEPIDPFDFEEFSPHFGLKGFLWGNSAVLAGLLLGRTFSQQGMKGMELGSTMVQGDLPLYYYTDNDGDQIALPCTERLASEAVAGHITSQSFMPVLWMRGRPEVRLGSFVSLAGTELAGPWAPVEIAPDQVAAAAPQPQPSAAATSPAASEPPAAQPQVPDSSQESVEEAAAQPPSTASAPAEEEADDLDALLGSLEGDSAAAPTAASTEGESEDSDDDLDALLASIEGGGEVDDEDSSDTDMDPDLASLLAEL